MPFSRATRSLGDYSDFAVTSLVPARAVSAGLGLLQRVLMTRRRTVPLITKTVSSNPACNQRPYRKVPTVNKEDQITAHPAVQPSKAKGIFSWVAAASASEMPA